MDAIHVVGMIVGLLSSMDVVLSAVRRIADAHLDEVQEITNSLRRLSETISRIENTTGLQGNQRGSLIELEGSRWGLDEEKAYLNHESHETISEAMKCPLYIHKRRFLKASTTALGESAAKLSAWASSVPMGAYVLQSPKPNLLHKDYLAMVPTLVGCSGGGRACMEIPRFLSDPSPAVFLAAMLLYGLGASSVYHLNRGDRFQDFVLAIGMTIGTGCGILSGENAMCILLRILPWTILLTLSVSAIGHQIYRCRKSTSDNSSACNKLNVAQ